jgi:hypothetical protein
MLPEGNIITKAGALTFGHIRALVAFYAASQRVEQESAFQLRESVDRLLALNAPRNADAIDRLFSSRESQGVYVHVSKPRKPESNPFQIPALKCSEKPFLRSKVTVGCAHQSVRSNILHLFRGKFEERDGRYILGGDIGLDAGVRLLLGIFFVGLFFIVPVEVLVHGGSLWKLANPGLGFWLMLETLYWYGKHDAAIISRHIAKALNP